jgi:hypothetical protein
MTRMEKEMIHAVEELEKQQPPRTVLPAEDSHIGVDSSDVAKRSDRSIQAAVAARIAGASYLEIARVFEYKNPQTARHAVETAMAGAYDDPNDMEAMRGVTTARLETLLRSLAPKALSDKMSTKNELGEKVFVDNVEHIVYARTFLSVVDRLAKLHGLDAPQVHRFETPDVARLNEVISTIVTARNELVAPEADIFADEIIVEEEAAS